ncbi:DEAD/DEAH box helicase [Isachenkonia alkalipeptolytica]|uniref:Helicase n=1 Tax=Isachenkonia alkalipeptolytica TaxID=2565777 RepID=A0AA43XKW8_9CLOT|nr:SNF2-related protein [Isachenkonia alkalipeptolytica]NBG88577.1 helicase [Isachenkonia alkalipeptolytica]
MHNITDETLKLRGALDTTYRKGLGIFNRGEIQSIRRTDNFRLFQGQVQGTRLYEMEAVFDEKGNIRRTRCTCPAFRSYYGDCKHITALLMSIDKYKDPRDNQENRMHSLIRAYREGETPPEKLLHFEPRVRVDGGKGEIELHLGENKTYVVKNIKEFLQSYSEEKPVVFGKNFTYDPNIHRFSREDQKMIDYLILLLDMSRQGEASGDENFGEVVFRGRTLVVKDRLLGELLKRRAAKDEGMGLWIDGEYYDGVRFKEEGIPMDLEVGESSRGSGLVLNKKETAPIIPLDGIENLTFYQGNIYPLKHPKNHWIRPLMKELITDGKAGVTIPKTLEKSFITEVLPVLQEHVHCRLQDDLAKRILKVPLKAKLFLDQEQKKVTAKLVFIYGNKEINPFAPEKNEKQKAAGPKEEEILVRERTAENHLLKLLEEGEFTVQKGRCYIEQEEKIYFFLENLLPKLQEDTKLSIYYSDDFKKVKTLGEEDIQGKITLNHGLDLLECSIDIKSIPKEEIGKLLKSIQEKAKYHRLANGTFLSLPQSSSGKLFTWFNEMELDPGDFEDGKLEIPKYRAFEIAGLQNEGEESLFDTGENFERFMDDYQQLTANMNPSKFSKEVLELPKGLTANLRSYQTKGFQWISTLSAYGFGGILADEMGLGKTIQALSYLLKEKERGALEPSILVVPTSLVYNWEDEIQRFSPDLKTLTISGTKEEREEKAKKIKDFDLVLTSYPLLRRDTELYEDQQFHACILDEAQHIKNKSSQSAKAVKSLRGKHRFVLTGTPLENNLTELWSIFDFLIPGYLGSYKSFTEKYQKPINKNGDNFSLKKLKRKVDPFILRRLKADVLKELPDKMEGKVLVDMTKEQQKLYRLYLQRIKGEIEDVVEEKGFNNSQIQILAGLTRLRQISCHPGVFIEDYHGGSGKLEALAEIVDLALESNHRLLIFSQFTGVLKKVREDLEKKGHRPLYLDGSIPMNQRGDLVKRFNKGEVPIFLISLKAGGTGLNLTSADMVIHMDPWWNPAVENQATDRAHRIGQKKKVQVKKLIARGTVEEKIHQIQEQKKAIIDQVIQKGETMLSKFSKEELLDLLEI